MVQRYYAEARFEQLKLKCNSCQTFVSRYRIHLAMWPDISFMSRSIIRPKVEALRDYKNVSGRD